MRLRWALAILAGRAAAFAAAHRLYPEARVKTQRQYNSEATLGPVPRIAPPPSDDVAADRRLVDRCRAGDVGAWEELYHQCHEPLLVAIRVFLGRFSAGDDLAEEIAARVWFNLVERDGALLDRFDSGRGCRLTTFLAALAKRGVLRYLRSERRRQLRETASLPRNRQRSRPPPSEAEFELSLAEFLATLSSREREFCEGYLLAGAPSADSEYSATNRWQLRHRVKLKLSMFLDED
jgi:DNA-directed RNA polymerase specialized sigma24 family protein